MKFRLKRTVEDTSTLLKNVFWIRNRTNLFLSCTYILCKCLICICWYLCKMRVLPGWGIVVCLWDWDFFFLHLLIQRRISVIVRIKYIRTSRSYLLPSRRLSVEFWFHTILYLRDEAWVKIPTNTKLAHPRILCMLLSSCRVLTTTSFVAHSRHPLFFLV